MMTTTRRSLTLVALGALLATTAPFVQASTVEEVQERGELVMLCWPHQESVFAHRMVKELGREGLHVIGGIDVDLMRLFAERLGVELVVKPVEPDYGALIPSLLAGEGDVIASSMTITQKRGQRVDFSIPYYHVKKVVVTRRGSSIRSVKDLAGKVGSVAHGTSHEEHILSLRLPDLRLRLVQFALENYLAVADREGDFTLVDSSSATRVLSEYGDLGKELEVAFTFPEEDGFGIAVVPGSDLRESLDLFLREIQESGELDAILRRHLKTAPGTQIAAAD